MNKRKWMCLEQAKSRRAKSRKSYAIPTQKPAFTNAPFSTSQLSMVVLLLNMLTVPSGV